MEMPLVSIIVPVYNAQSHLSRCLESICGQEYKNLELIVINDGSKDQSLPVCEEFRKKDSRILLVDKANSGVSDTRNLGLKLAGGKYVQFVDSDDYIAPDYTARLVEAAEKTGADLVISPYTMVIPAGASKPEQVLEKIQDDLGVMHVARPPENREYGFLPEGVYDKDTFARRLMDKPASYFYSVLWNKLYRRILLTGRQHGLLPKIHADEIEAIGGSELAGEIGAVSAEHLIVCPPSGIASMAEGGTVACCLPATSFYLGAAYAPVQDMVQAGVPVAMATDFNPGSCPCLNMQFVINLGCLKYKLTPEEVLTAVTLNGAAAIDLADKVGSVEEGKMGDLVIWDAPDLDYICYRVGSNLAKTVIKRGEIV